MALEARKRLMEGWEGAPFDLGGGDLDGSLPVLTQTQVRLSSVNKDSAMAMRPRGRLGKDPRRHPLLHLVEGIRHEVPYSLPETNLAGPKGQMTSDGIGAQRKAKGRQGRKLHLSLMEAIRTGATPFPPKIRSEWPQGKKIQQWPRNSLLIEALTNKETSDHWFWRKNAWFGFSASHRPG